MKLFSFLLVASAFTANSFAKDCTSVDQTYCFYGFLIPSWVAASEGAESFSQPNLSAFTAAANPVLHASHRLTRSSFQLAQSRVGFVVKPEPKTTGRLEFDFIDFSKASPTTAALPRVRRAVIDHALSDSLTLRFGQDWDLVSPLGPHSYNFVGHYFQSGDIAFMRIQAQLVMKAGEWEHAFALGLPASNNSAGDSLLELGVMPTFAVRETLKLGTGSKVGASAIATQLRRSFTRDDRMFAGAATAFGEFSHGALELRTEAYLAQNSFNLGMLGLAFGNNAAPAVREAGAFVTAKLRPDPSWAIFGGVGGSWVLDPARMLSSYSGATPALAGTGPGMERNLTTRVGGEFTLSSALNVFAEVSGLFSRHHFAAADVGNFPNDTSAWITQVGMFLSW